MAEFSYVRRLKISNVFFILCSWRNYAKSNAQPLRSPLRCGCRIRPDRPKRKKKVRLLPPSRKEEGNA